MNMTGNLQRDGLFREETPLCLPVKDQSVGLVTEGTPICLPDQKDGLVTEETRLCLPVKDQKVGLVTEETPLCLPDQEDGLVTEETPLCLPVNDQKNGLVTEETPLCFPIKDQYVGLVTEKTLLCLAAPDQKVSESFHGSDNNAGNVTENLAGSFLGTDKRVATHSFMESTVRSIQANVECERARKIQKAVAGSLRYFLREVGKIEPLFCSSNLIQVGSYAEGTKLHEPDEFDFLVEIDGLSQPRTIVLHNTQKSQGVSKPGCVAIALADDYLKLKWDTFCVDGTLQCFQSRPLSQSFSGPTKFGTIFVRAIKKIMKENRARMHTKGHMTMCTPVDINFPGDGLELPQVGDITLHLMGVEFKTPNVLIGYRLDGLEISVDLSPAIRYHKIEDCFKSEECASPQLTEAIVSHGSVLLVGDKSFDFRISVTECEVLYMQRIMKREHKFIYMFLKYVKGMVLEPFSSYMLKAVCIHHDARCQPHVQNVWACFGNIVEDINIYCTERRLPSAINCNINLFATSDSEAKDYVWNLRLGMVEILRVIYKLSSEIDTVEQFETVMQQAIDLAQGRSRLSDMLNSYGDHTETVWLYQRTCKSL